MGFVGNRFYGFVSIVVQRKADSFHWRIGFATSLVLIAAFLATSLIISRKTGELAKSEALARLHDTGHRYGDEIRSYLINGLNMARYLAMTLELAVENRPQIRREDFDRLFVRTIQQNDSYFGAWAVFGPNRFDGRDAEFAGQPGQATDGGYVPFAYRRTNGEIVFKHDEYEVDKEFDYYTIPMNSGTESLIHPYADVDAEGVLMTSLAVPVYEQDQVIGVAGVDIELASLNDRVKAIKPYGDGYAFMITDQGMIVSHPRREFLGRSLAEAGIDAEFIRQLQVDGDASPVRYDPLTQKQTWFDLTPIQIVDTAEPWALVLAVATDRIIGPARSVTRWTISVGLLSVVLLSGLMFYLGRLIIFPLQRAETMLRSLLDSMVDGVMVHDARGTIQDFNKPFLAMFGLDSQSAPSVNVYHLIEGIPGIADLRSAVTASTQGKVIHGEARGSPKDGRASFPLEFSIRKLSSGNRPLVLTTVRDITDRVKAEQERQLTLERVRRQEAAIVRLALHKPEEGDLKAICRFATELASEAMQTERVSIWLGNASVGSIACLDLFRATERDHSSGSILTAQDFPAYFAAIASGRSIDAHDAHRDPRTNEFSTPYLTPLGITSMLDSVIRISDVIEGVICFEHVGPMREWTIDEIRFATEVADQLAKFIVFSQRRTEEEERKKLELQFQQTQKLESLGILAGGIAHDFNNLLHTIIGNLDMAIADLTAHSPIRKDLEESRRASKHAADLCTQMLAYSGRGSFVVQPLRLDELAREMKSILESSVGTRATLSLCCPSPPPPILADASQIRQILLNLVINAADAMNRPDGTITVEIGVMRCDEQYFQATYLKEPRPPGKYVYLEVKDNGMGMDEATLEKIFDPFFTTKFTGRGLGLASVLGIVRGHRGAIRIDSAPGQGTVFRVLFPAAVLAALPAVAATSKARELSGTGTILLVDDDHGVRRTIARQLTRLGYGVVEAVDGVDALGLLEQNLQQHSPGDPGRFVLVFLDLTMPRLGGEETFDQIHQRVPDLPVVLCSGYSDDEAQSKFEGKGIAGFIPKPYEYEALKALLRRLLGPAEG